MMYSTVILLLAMGIAMAAENQTSPPGSKHGDEALFRKILCEKNDMEFYKALDFCFTKEDESIVDATKDCIKEVSPEVKDDGILFLQEACKDPSIFKKFDDCYDEYLANPAFKEVDSTNEAKECLSSVLKKYEINYE